MRGRVCAALRRLVASSQGEAALSSSTQAVSSRLAVSPVFRAATPACLSTLASSPSSPATLGPAAAAAVSTTANQSAAAPGGSRGFAAAAAANSGGQLAQRVLQADPAKVDSGLVEAIRAVEPQAVPAVARAAQVTGIADKAFLEALAESAVRAMPDLAPGDICSVAEDLAELGCYNIAFKDALADHVLEKLEGFDGDMLGKTLRAFGSMHYYDDDLLEGVVSYVQANPGKFSTENIADVVYAFSKCGFCHPDLVGVVEHAAEKLMAEPVNEGGKAIADILDAYSRVGCSSPDAVDELVEKLPAHCSKFEPECLAKVTVATIRLGYDDSNLLVPMLDCTAEHLGSLSAKSIIKLIRVLGELGTLHRPLLDKVTDDVIPARLSEFKMMGLDDLVHSLNKLGYYNSEFLQLMKQVQHQRAGQAANEA